MKHPSNSQALTSPLCCPSQIARSVSVHGHGYLTLALRDVPGLQDFYSGFSFRTSQHEGLLYHHTTQVGTCSPSSCGGCLCTGDSAASPWEKGRTLMGPEGESAARSAPWRVVRKWALPRGPAPEDSWHDAFCRRGCARCPSRGANWP